MRRLRSVLAAMVLVALAWPSLASAQAASGTDRVRVSVNGGVQLSSIGFDTSAEKTGAHLESAVIGALYDATHGLAIDGGASVRLARDIGVAVTVSSFMQEHDAAVSAAIPHPFFFRTPRTITGTAASLRHDELVTHLQGTYTLYPSRRVDVLLSAGPSFFHVRQDVVTDIAFTDTYPVRRPGVHLGVGAAGDGEEQGRLQRRRRCRHAPGAPRRGRRQRAILESDRVTGDAEQHGHGVD